MDHLKQTMARIGAGRGTAHDHATVKAQIDEKINRAIQRGLRAADFSATKM